MDDNMSDEEIQADLEEAMLEAHDHAHAMAVRMMKVIEDYADEHGPISPAGPIWAAEIVASSWRRMAIEAKTPGTSDDDVKAFFKAIREWGSKCARGFYEVLRRRGELVDRADYDKLERPNVPHGGEA